jgi:hypothetical protein
MEQSMNLDLLFLSRSRSKEPKSLWSLSNRSDLESSVIATHIELILIVTGAATATMLGQFFAPLPVLRLIFGEAPTDAVSVALARHWGLLIFCVGALLIYAAFYPPVRGPILLFAVIEKIGLGVCVLGTSLRRQGVAGVLAAADLLMALVYILYLSGL